ncbi:MAG: hypothetical protein V9F04_05140 [Dermatophilaceae bacterium]
MKTLRLINPLLRSINERARQRAEALKASTAAVPAAVLTTSSDTSTATISTVKE